LEKGLDVERMRREEAARLLVLIVESSDDAILSKTLDGVITSWNAAATRIFGYSADEAIGAHISLLIPPDRMAEEAEIISQMKAGHTIKHYETVRRHKNGAEILVSLSVSPIRDSAGKIVGASKIARDITENRQTEGRLQMVQAELAHVARLNAMGQMSAALAHELNQPLTAITNYINASQRMLEDPQLTPQIVTNARNAMEKAGAQTMRAGTIIRRLRDFVEKREMARRTEDLNLVVEDSMALALVGAADSSLTHDLALPSAPLPVMIDRVQIQQVLINLIRNSAEALAGTTDGKITISAGMKDTGTTWLLVSDNGPGLPAEVRARLFQPFVTTKEKGMGIGLTICQSIIEAHGGSIHAVSEEAKGTAFRIELPADQSR
jgi:two-component system, LuxR family, sensor kinase FixL